MCLRKEGEGRGREGLREGEREGGREGGTEEGGQRSEGNEWKGKDEEGREREGEDEETITQQATVPAPPSHQLRWWNTITVAPYRSLLPCTTDTVHRLCVYPLPAHAPHTSTSPSGKRRNILPSS